MMNAPVRFADVSRRCRRWYWSAFGCRGWIRRETSCERFSIAFLSKRVSKKVEIGVEVSRRDKGVGRNVGA